MIFPVTTIGESAFKGCTELTTIVLSGNLTYVGNLAFRNTKIESIYSHIKQPTDDNYPYGIEYNNVKLYVPRGMVEEYRRSTYWGRIKNIMEGDYDE